jgi:hypothetical protein
MKGITNAEGMVGGMHTQSPQKAPARERVNRDGWSVNVGRRSNRPDKLQLNIIADLAD